MKITIIGAGAMGGAIARGLVKSNAVSASDITVTAKTQKTLDSFANYGINTSLDNREAAANADIVCLAVKPWLMEEVINGIKDTLDYSRQIIISVAAGISAKQITEWMQRDGKMAPLFLVIPNIAIEQLASMTFVVPAGATDQQTATVKSLFDSMGSTLITDEQHLGAGMMLASCGIAFAMRYVRASAEGGVELGFKADVAKDIVLQTLKGTVSLLQANGNHPEAEIDKVTTPGGITIKGLNEMEHAGFTSAVIRGLKAGLKR